jgi:hypothetical protein
MSAYRGFVDKSTGKIIDLPNPEAYWGNDIHRQYYDFILNQGLPNPTKPGSPWYEWRDDWLDNSTVKFFKRKAEAEKYSNSIKTNAVLAEENKIGINRNAVTPAEKLANYEKAINAYSSNIKANNLGETEKNLYNKYKKASLVSDPQNFTDAVNNYFVEFSEAKLRGVENISSEQENKLSTYSKQLKDYYSKDLSPESAKLVQYVDDVQSAINSVNNQKQLVATQKDRVESLGGKEKENARARLVIEEDALSRLINTANQQAPEVVNALSKAVPSNIANIVAKTDERIGKVTEGLSALSSDRIFGTGDIAFKLNSQVTDQQIIDDINKAKVGEYKKLYELGQATTVDLQSRIKQAEDMLPSLSGQQKVSATKQIDDLKTELSQVTKDTLQAENLYKNYTGVSGTQASTAISKFRESLRLPEERTIAQIEQIDPTIGATVRGLAKQYQKMATTPLGQTQNAKTEAFRAELEKGYRDYSKSPIGKTQDAQTEAYRAQLQKEIQGYSLGKIGATTTPEAEALRRQVEGETAAQLALGSRLGAEEQRQYQQYSRGAQAARGNIFGVAPAVEEAVTTGMAGEARKQARYGAASQFLSSGQTTSDALARDIQLREALQQGRYQTGGAMLTSGQTVSDAMARDVQLRNALEQSKLGAGSQFMASGQTMSDATARDIGLRNALEQSRLGAAQGFIASGPTMYNLASQRLGTQQGLLNNYLAASAPQATGTFQGTPSAANPYAYVNPNAGFVGAQNAANIYNTLADYASQTYGAQVGAISRQQSGAQQAASILGGVSGFTGLFGGPGSNAFFRG